MTVDLVQAVDARVASVFRPTEVYFPPYGEEEVSAILRDRVVQGLYPNALPEPMFRLVVEQTMKSGDLRVGIDLLKRATLSAEKAARRRAIQLMAKVERREEAAGIGSPTKDPAQRKKGFDQGGSSPSNQSE